MRRIAAELFPAELERGWFDKKASGRLQLFRSSRYLATAQPSIVLHSVEKSGLRSGGRRGFRRPPTPPDVRFRISAVGMKRWFSVMGFDGFQQRDKSHPSEGGGRVGDIHVRSSGIPPRSAPIAGASPHFGFREPQGYQAAGSGVYPHPPPCSSAPHLHNDLPDKFWTLTIFAVSSRSLCLLCGFCSSL